MIFWNAGSKGFTGAEERSGRQGWIAILEKAVCLVGFAAVNVLPFPPSQYLLRNLIIDRPNQVWSTDITYIPMAKGFVYLVAVIDWYSR